MLACQRHQRNRPGGCKRTHLLLGIELAIVRWELEGATGEVGKGLDMVVEKAVGILEGNRTNIATVRCVKSVGSWKPQHQVIMPQQCFVHKDWVASRSGTTVWSSP